MDTARRQTQHLSPGCQLQKCFICQGRYVRRSKKQPKGFLWKHTDKHWQTQHLHIRWGNLLQKLSLQEINLPGEQSWEKHCACVSITQWVSLAGNPASNARTELHKLTLRMRKRCQSKGTKFAITSWQASSTHTVLSVTFRKDFYALRLQHPSCISHFIFWGLAVTRCKGLKTTHWVEPSNLSKSDNKPSCL